MNAPSSPPPASDCKLVASPTPVSNSPSVRLRAWYAARSARERRLLALAAAVVLGGSLIAAAEHLVAERERLTRSLPTARLAYLAMEQDSLGLAALRERPAPARPPLAALPGAIRAAASTRGIEAEARIAGNLVEVGGRTTLPAAIDWLAAVHAEQRLRPTRLELQPAGSDGQARFEAVFEVAGE
ncbi:MAG: type II secretion system protein M [Thauera sp.]|nr:type II secretion system protein M [Thauera sp.]